jgi:HAD superfamily hydrolase (TIGR01662 family)
MVTKLVIFDFDGVLMNSLEFLKEVYRRIADLMDIDIPLEDETFRELLELDWKETYRKLGIIEKDKVNLSEFTYHHFASKKSELIMPYPRIKDVLHTLHGSYKIAIVSNSFKRDILRLLKTHGLEYFDKVFTPEDGILKPNPDLLLKCMKYFKAKPSETIFFGDMDGDIIAGKAAGIKTVAVTYGFHLRHRLKDADMVIEAPEQIITALGMTR